MVLGFKGYLLSAQISLLRKLSGVCYALVERDHDTGGSRPRPQPGAGSVGKSWRDLIPVIKVDVSSVSMSPIAQQSLVSTPINLFCI